MKRQWFLLVLLLVSCGREGAGPDTGGSDDGRGAVGDEGEAPVPPTGLLGCRARGFNFVCWYRDCFEEEETAGTLDIMKEHGSNWVEVVPTWYQETARSNEIALHPDRSPTVQDVRSVILAAKARGYRVALKPHVDLLDGSWRGTIEPTDLSQWQASYEEFMMTFAAQSQALGVEVLAIGTELKSRSGETDFWRRLAARIRGEYDGTLTYASNWDEYEEIGFWEDLDFVGIDFYNPLTDTREADREAMEEALEPIRARLAAFSESVDRPVLITEVGYRSVDGTNTRPYDWEMGGEIDLQEQADAFDAFLRVFGEDEGWLEGIFWWNAQPILEEGEDDRGYSPFGKPAADLLKAAWGGVTCVDP